MPQRQAFLVTGTNQAAVSGCTHYNWTSFTDSISASAFTAMQPITGPAHSADIEVDFWRELAEIEAESMGWLPLSEGCYLHTGTPASEVLIVGTASASLADLNVLWVC